MSSFRTILFALPLVVAAALTGCASEPGEDTADATGAATASGAITVQNYVTHPKIVAIRQQVAAIDAMALTKTENPGCDGSNTKYADASGQIRKLVSQGGEGGFEATNTLYFGADGMTLFVFHKEADLTGELVKDAKNAWVTESRVYFDATGATMFQVVRNAELKSIDDAVPASADRLPQSSEKVEHASEYGDPAEYFASTGCGGGEVEEPGHP